MYRDMDKRKEPFSLYTHTRSRRRGEEEKKKQTISNSSAAAPELLETLSDRLQHTASPSAAAHVRAVGSPAKAASPGKPE